MFSATKKDEVLDACCDARQACDQICGSTLRLCEETFDKCLQETCSKQPNEEDCKKDANIHKLMVSLSGDVCQTFTPSQNLGCECLPEERAKKRRKTILKDIYAKHAPESLDKVDGLAAKSVDTPKKFATLLIKLVAKYPAIVNVIGDPKSDYFENLFKDSKKDLNIKLAKDADPAAHGGLSGGGGGGAESDDDVMDLDAENNGEL